MAATVHPLDDAQLDVQVDLIMDDPDAAQVAAETGLFEVRNKDRANRALWKIGRLDDDLAEDEALYRAERARLDDWIAERRLRHERAVAWLSSLTAGFHAVVLHEDPKRKTIKLPAGELWARGGQPEWDIADRAFIEWAEANRPDLLNRPPKVDRNAVKAAFAEMIGTGEEGTGPEGRVVLDDGEIVPGILVRPAVDNYSARPHKAADR